MKFYFHQFCQQPQNYITVHLYLFMKECSMVKYWAMVILHVLSYFKVREEVRKVSSVFIILRSSAAIAAITLCQSELNDACLNWLFLYTS